MRCSVLAGTHNSLSFVSVATVIVIGARLGLGLGKINTDTQIGTGIARPNATISQSIVRFSNLS